MSRPIKMKKFRAKSKIYRVSCKNKFPFFISVIMLPEQVGVRAYPLHGSRPDKTEHVFLTKPAAQSLFKDLTIAPDPRSDRRDREFLEFND